MENSLRHDKQASEAFRLINNPAEYNAILDGTYKPDADEDDAENDDDDTKEDDEQ